MEKRLVSGLLLILSLFTSSVAGKLQQEPTRGQTVSPKSPALFTNGLDYEESHALIIGISRYQNGWRELPGVRKDVDEVSAVFRRHGFQVTVKLDVTQVELDRALRDFVSSYGQQPKNRLVVYFAGHGHTLITPDKRPLGYIVPADAPVPESKNPGPFKRLAISMSDIEKYAREIESKHALFVFDSCFSGSLFRLRSSTVPDSISAATDHQVRQFITAGTENQVVPDVSVFRSKFVSALEGDADFDGDGYITGSEVGYFLRKTVTDYTRKQQTPEYGKIRDPDLDKGDMVFLSPKGPSVRPPTAQTVLRPEAPLSGESTASPSTGRWTVLVDKPIQVEASAGWIETGIQIKPGQQISLRSGGQQINLGALGMAGPGGVYKTDSRKPLHDCPTGALVALVGKESICVESERSFSVTTEGSLRLGVNESNYGDNRGAWVVRVVVQEFRR